MGSGPWAYGNALSLADCVLAFSILPFQNMLSVATTENLGVAAFDPQRPFSNNPKLAAWWRHMENHPLVGQAMRDFFAESEKTLAPLIPNRSPSAYGIFIRARAPRP